MKKKWIISGTGLALLLMGITSLASYQNANSLVENSNEVEHTHELLETLTDISATLLDAESGRRGYLLTGEREELTRYNYAVQIITPKLHKLEQLTSTRPQQNQRLATLKDLINKRLILFDQSIKLYQRGQPLVAVQSFWTLQRKQNREQIRQIIWEMQETEKQLLRLKISQSQASLRYRMVIEFLLPLLSFALLLTISALLYQQILKRHQAEVLQRSVIQEKELSELKLRFFSMVSHEFRTPLSLILGSVQLLLEGDSRWEEKKLKHLHRIQSTARKTTRLLTDLLTLTRADAGKLKFNPHFIDVEAFCLNLLEDAQVSVESKRDIKFISKVQGFYAYLDEDLLYPILSNLLSNALKYSFPEGSILFTLSQEAKNTVVFQIRDEGIGISSEEQCQLYEPFYRSRKANRIDGSGLGLAVVKKCVDVHQGNISVDSQVGVGTTFTVKLPSIESLVKN